MVDRVTLAGLEALALDGAALGFKVVYVVRGLKTMCSVEITGVQAGPVVVAGVDGGVRYWSGVSAALFDLVQAAKPVGGNLAMVVEGAALLFDATGQTKPDQVAEVNKALLANAAAYESANDKIALLADVPQMRVCLEGERVALQARLAALLAP